MQRVAETPRRQGPNRVSAVFFAAALLAAACGGARRAGRSLDPVPVQVERLESVSIPESDRYLAALTSRHAVSLYTQVSGIVRRIAVRPGEHVGRGQLLVSIDSGQQAANLRALEADLHTQEAQLAYAVTNDVASKRLYEEGLLSRLDYDQRHAARASAEANVASARAQLAAQRSQLLFYDVRSPTSGTVGDVPVKIGQFVPPQTQVTSVDQDRFVEAYVYVPREKISQIGPQTRVDVMDAAGTLCSNAPTFVSPRTQADTQTVLVKTVCPNTGALRSEDVLTARVVWSEHRSVTVPILATLRESGQYFVFVVASTKAGDVARQRPIAVGTIVGNDYAVTEGLAPGERVVVTNVQKLRDGAPIRVEEARAAR